jgi:hypothetical protein
VALVTAVVLLARLEDTSIIAAEKIEKNPYRAFHFAAVAQ